MRYTVRRRFYRRKNNQGWSPQQTVINAELGLSTTAYSTGMYDIVAPITEEGSRTVTHLQIKLLTDLTPITDDAS